VLYVFFKAHWKIPNYNDVGIFARTKQKKIKKTLTVQGDQMSL
jgi:hypothetical protein